MSNQTTPDAAEAQDPSGSGLGGMPCSQIILHLTLHRKWFDMILSGQKREEYREMKPYWNLRLARRRYDAISFRNGYAKDAPQMLVELKEHLSGLGIIEWGAPAETPVHILRLGRIISADVKVRDRSGSGTPPQNQPS